MAMKSRRSDQGIQRLNIIPLIDVVFMLMAFLLMTFKISVPEGDFEVNLAHAGVGSASADLMERPAEPIYIRMISDAAGNLVTIKVGDIELGPEPRRLRNHIIKMLKNSPNTDRKHWMAEIQFDRLLKYQHTMDGISAVRGHFVGNNFVPLIEKINVREFQ